MDQRHASLLVGLVEEYIRTAHPVGSRQLLRYLHLEVSPATVRNLIHELDEAGYVLQPHTSAGRIPTDKGYRFYVDHIRLRAVAAARQHALDMQLREAAEQYQHLARAVSKLLARLSGSVAAIGVFPDGAVQETGLNELLKQPEGEDTATMQEVSHMLEHVDEYLHDLAQRREHVTVYIGRENPYLPAQHTSVVARVVALPRAQTAVLTVMGPKRMPYQRHMLLLEQLAAVLRHHSL